MGCFAMCNLSCVACRPQTLSVPCGQYRSVKVEYTVKPDQRGVGGVGRQSLLVKNLISKIQLYYS